MLGKLTDDQIDHVLNNQFVGRIGCCSQNKMYVVPVTYVYHKDTIYVHSKEGLKVKMMRENPEVCFEVDAVDNMTNWRSVILWGKYEELKSEEDQQLALKILTDHFAPFTISQSVRTSSTENVSHDTLHKGRLRPVAYRIVIREKTGRFEKS